MELILKGGHRSHGLVDLSKNRLCELPEELCQFISLETLSLYHNCIRSLTPSLCHLQALTYLNLSRNLISNLPPSVCQLPLLRVLIVSNNKLLALPASIHTLTHLRQLDVSCNDLQCLPVELGQLECLRDLNLRRNRLTMLPKELSELPLVRLDVSCNCISHVPVCYRHLRHLQTIILDNNPLQQPTAQVCSKGKFHIFKFLNIEACKRSQEELERALRPTGYNSCHRTPTHDSSIHNLTTAANHQRQTVGTFCVNTAKDYNVIHSSPVTKINKLLRNLLKRTTAQTGSHVPTLSQTGSS